MSDALPLVKIHPTVRAARDAFDRGDHAAARATLATLDRAEATIADHDALTRMDQGLAADWAPWIVGLLCLAGWAVLFLRAA